MSPVPTPDPPADEIPPDIFEALVSLWTEIMYTDYLARHPKAVNGAGTGGIISANSVN